MPLGIDPERLEPPVRARPWTADHFTFLISGGGHRKGADLVIDAFRKVFDGRVADGPAPRLFVHSAKASEFPRDERIHLITGKLTDEEEVALYAMAHVYVSHHAAKASACAHLQAMAQGCPTIATNAHGHAAYRPISSPIRWAGSTTRLRRSRSTTAQQGSGGSRTSMSCVSDGRRLPQLHGGVRRLKSTLSPGNRREFNWDETARKYLDAIGRDRLELPDIVRASGSKPQGYAQLPRPCQQHRFFEVGGLQYLLDRWEGVPGEKDYWEPADVKRTLFDGGHLDPSCLTHLQKLMTDGEDERELGIIDTGLTPEQYELIPQYTGAHAFCPSCSQKLNTNLPTLEEMEALPMPREVF